MFRTIQVIVFILVKVLMTNCQCTINIRNFPQTSSGYHEPLITKARAYPRSDELVHPNRNGIISFNVGEEARISCVEGLTTGNKLAWSKFV